jgi:hypothetical protein
MWCWTSSLLNGPYAIPLFAIAAGVFGWICVTIAVQWRRAREAAYNARLKQLMIERGMSAAEIKTVLEADAGRYDSED